MVYKIEIGNCLDILSDIDENSIDCIITDPPYGLSNPPDISKVLLSWLNGQDYCHGSNGFMGQDWDSFVPGPAVWRECLRVLKPGGHLLSFFGSRTLDIGSMAVRLAGFEVRDTLMWVYGSGFSKSMNISKAFVRDYNRQKKDQAPSPALLSAAEQWSGWGTTLKPALDPILLARKPLEGRVIDNVLAHGCGGININDCLVEPTGESKARGEEASREKRYKDSGSTNFAAQPGAWRGGNPKGRIPSNLIHDGSEEVLSCFPQAPGQMATSSSNEASPRTRQVYGSYGRSDEAMSPRGDLGSAARFFYAAKAKKEDRNEGLDDGFINDHTTVKPTPLMRYLCRLVTPPGGVVLDPFMGSGSTGKGALLEGFSFVGIEQDEHYAEIARQRLNFASNQTD